MIIRGTIVKIVIWGRTQIWSVVEAILISNLKSIQHKISVNSYGNQNHNTLQDQWYLFCIINIHDTPQQPNTFKM